MAQSADFNRKLILQTYSEPAPLDFPLGRFAICGAGLHLEDIFLVRRCYNPRQSTRRAPVIIS